MLATGRLSRDDPDNTESIAEFGTYMRQLFPLVDVENYMWTVLASIMIGDTSQNQKMHYLYGRGKNGKSVFLETFLPALFGEYHYPLLVSFWTSTRPVMGVTLPELADSEYRRCIVSQEPRQNDVLNEQSIKVMVGGTDSISARQLYEGNRKFVSQGTCFLAANYKLSMGASDYGTWRRIVLILFHAHFYKPGDSTPSAIPEEFKFLIDSQIISKIKKWAPIVLSKLIWINNQTRGILKDITSVPSINRATLQY